MERRIGNLDIVLFFEPLLDAGVASESFRLGESLFELLEDLVGNGLLAGLRAGLSDVLKPIETSFFVELKPIGDRIAMDAQMAGRSAPAFGLSGLQKKQHVETALNLGLSLPANEGFELVDWLGNLGKVVHRSTGADKERGYEGKHTAQDA